MHTFRGNPLQPAAAWFMAILLGGSARWEMSNASVGHAPGEAGGVRAMFGLLGVFVVACFGYVTLECLTAYQVDAEGITRRGWNGVRRVRWQDIVGLETIGGANGLLRLTDIENNRLTLQRGLLSRASLAELNRLLDLHLAPVRERQRREIGTHRRVVHPRRRMAWAYALTLPLAGGMMAFMLSQPPQQKPGEMTALTLLIFGGMELTLLHLALLGFTHALIVTPYGLVETCAFWTRRIPFHNVTSVTTRAVTLWHNHYDVTTIAGSGRKISLASHAADYDLLTEYIRTRVAAAVQQGSVLHEEALQRKADARARILLPLCAVLYMLVPCGLACMTLRDSNTRLQYERLLDTQGRTTIGHILGKAVERSSVYSTYLLRYAFDAPGGQHVEAESPVAWDDYQNARIGASAQVIYVPGSTAISRLERSIGRQQAEGKARSSYLMLVMGTFIALSMAMLPFIRRRKEEMETLSAA